MMKRILIVGAGASGMAAAIAAAETDPTAQIILIEALDRVGKKILVTGNGRCNLANESIACGNYHSSDPDRLKALLRQMPAHRTLDFFASLGLLCTSDEAGRVYPYCNQASMVLDTLRHEVDRVAHVECGQIVREIKPQRNGFLVKTEAGRQYHGDRLILATGGLAAPKQGGLGIGYQLASQLGLALKDVFPCLVALRCHHPALKGLKGIRAHCSATLRSNDRVLHQETGEIQFTDYGLSGIPSMQLSCHLTGKRDIVCLDLLPDWSEDTWTAHLTARLKGDPNCTLEELLLGTVNKRLMAAVCKDAGFGPMNAPADHLTENAIRKIVRTAKCWTFPVSGTQGWDQAQVTRGGVSLCEINEQFESLRYPRLYLTGELLDAAGDCGGYNLHWAWCSGMISGTASAK